MRQYIDLLQDNSGNAITVGGTVVVRDYPSGSLSSIYSDNGLTPIGGSTVSTDSTGQFAFFAADADYTLQFYVNGLLYKTQTPVTIFDGAAQVTMPDTGSANAYAISGSNLEKALRAGLRCAVQIANTNTNASTLQYNTLTAKPIILSDGTVLTDTLLTAGGIFMFEYNGSAWQLLASTAVPGLSTYIRDSQHRGVFTLPSSVHFFGDSFFEQPNSHTSSGNSMAFKAAALLGVTGVISATSGNTSVDKQDAIFASNPAATDVTVIGLGQNDAQFISTGTDVERRLNDVAGIHLANHFQSAVPTGSLRTLASAMTQSGGSAWTADADIPEGGALKSNTTGDTLAATVTDSRYIVVFYKIKTGNAGQFSVVIDGTTHNGSVDPDHGFHNYPFGSIPTNTGKTYARSALVFDLGRRKPTTTVQFVVSSATAGGNVVTICSVMGLSGAPLSGPLLCALDLSDRGAAGYATAAGSQSAVQCISRIINYSLASVGVCGPRVVPVALSTVINVSTNLDADQFHPNESGANNAAQAMATAIQGAAKDWSVIRPDLDSISLVNGADGYVLQSQLPLSMGADFQIKRGLMSPRGVFWTATDPIPCVTSVRWGAPDATGWVDPANCAILVPPQNFTDALTFGNFANGSFSFVAYQAIKARITQTGIISPATETFAPETDEVLQLGAFAKQFTTGWFSQYVRTKPTTVGGLPAAGSSIEGARWAVTDANATFTAGIGAVVAAGGANHVPVYCDGTNWRIG